MHSLAVALLLTSSAFAVASNEETQVDSNEETPDVDDGEVADFVFEDRRRAFNWPSSFSCQNNYDCKQIGQYCYSFGGWLNYCSTGQAVGSLCSTSHDCGTQGYKPLTCQAGVCCDTPSPSPSPSPSGCTTSDDCKKVGWYCYGQYSMSNGVCQQGDGLSSLCRTNAQCGYIGNRPLSCEHGICIDTGSSPGIGYGRRLGLPSASPPQPEDDNEERRRPYSDMRRVKNGVVQPMVGFAGPSGTNCKNNYDCKHVGQYCYEGHPMSYCSTGNAVGSLCSTNAQCGTQGYKQLTCKWGKCANTPSPSPSPSPSGCKTSDDCKKVGWYCYGEYSMTNGVCRKGDGISSLCKTNAQCGYIGNRQLSCQHGICIDTGSSPGIGSIGYGRRRTAGSPTILKYPTPPGLNCKTSSDCYQGQICAKGDPFNSCKWEYGQRRAEVLKFPPPLGCGCKTSDDCDTWQTGEYCFTTGTSYNCCVNKNPLGALCGGHSECGPYNCVGGVCKASGRRLEELEH